MDDIKKQETECDAVCAIDPGCREIATVYDEKNIKEIGAAMNQTLGPLIEEREQKKKKYKEEILLRRQKSNDKDYEKAKKEYRSINEKIENKVNDLHYKAIKKLTSEYSLIYIPKLNVKRILEQENMPKKVKRQLQMECHGKYIKRLKEKAEIMGSKVEIITEYLTTQICSQCFERNDPKKSKVYKCVCCGLVTGRDINSAKNIYIQQIAKIIKNLLDL
jgi:putative transposase